MIYRPVEIHDWPDAYHVFDDTRDVAVRIGIVNKKVVRHYDENGSMHVRESWFAHNKHFFTIAGEYPTRTAAANAIPKGAIHHSVSAFS